MAVDTRTDVDALEDEVWYSELLRKEFPEAKLEERNRQIDFVCIGVGDTVRVIELKRPGTRSTQVILTASLITRHS